MMESAEGNGLLLAAEVSLPAEEEAGTGQEAERPAPSLRWLAFFILLVFALGVGSGYLLWGRPAPAPVAAPQVVAAAAEPAVALKGAAEGEDPPQAEAVPVPQPISLPASYTLPASFGDLGPRLVQAGAIDLERFVQTYQSAGRPLGEAELAILRQGSQEPIVIDHGNAYFLLNFFWALGLTNQNPLLASGPLMTYSEGNIGRFASTGGWTLGQRTPVELYNSAPLLPLTAAQQARVEKVANGVYRPCCNNHTAFADCNHGMAMLGLLELLASQDASEEEMFSAAKYANSFWFPQQAQETALFFKVVMELDYADVDPRMAVGPEVFSGTGFRTVHQWLVANDLLQKTPSGGANCGV